MATVVKVQGDASNVETSFEHVKPGLYYLRAEEISPRNSKNGDEPMAEIIFQPTKDAKGKKIKDPKSPSRIYYYVPLDPGATWARRLKEFLVAYGLPMKNADLGKAVGKECLARLKEDKDQDDNYRPRIANLLKPKDADVDEEEEDEEEPEAEEDEEPEAYTEDELTALKSEDLKEVAAEFDVKVPARLTAKSKPKLIAAILEAQGEADEEEEEDEEEAEDEHPDIDAMSRKELKALIEEEELEIKVLKKDSDDDVRAKIREAWGVEEDEEEEEEDEEEEDEEEEGDNYDSMSLSDLKQECEDRELASTGKKAILIARLRKDDQSDPV